MDDKTEELIALIAKKHGIALDETDRLWSFLPWHITFAG